jgi:hypothetical protein
MDNAIISRVGWDEANGRATVAIDRAVSYCKSASHDSPSHVRDLLEIDLPGGTWKLTPKVAQADNLPPYVLPAGDTDLFEGMFHSSCLGCELIVPVGSGAGVLHFTVAKDRGEPGPIRLGVSSLGAPALDCAIGYDTSCLKVQ